RRHTRFSRDWSSDVCSSDLPEQVQERLADAEVAVISKVRMTAAVLDAAPALKLILIAATGTDNVDLEAARERGIAVYNCQAYGTAAVAQHTLALMLEIGRASCRERRKREAVAEAMKENRKNR